MTDEVEDFLAHYGVKGMKWGVRKDRDGSDKLRLAGPYQGPVVTGKLHKNTLAATKEVSALVEERYGFVIKDVTSIGPGNSEYENGTVGYVKLGGSGDAKEGSLFVSQDNLGPGLKYGEEVGWFGKDTGNEKAFITHETAHAIFHAPVQKVQGLTGVKEVGGHIKERNVALKAAVKEAQREGIPGPDFARSISGYVDATKVREEAEAEMFSQYHWGDNPNNFVKVWGETLHREMGLDPTPFKERR